MICTPQKRNITFGSEKIILKARPHAIIPVLQILLLLMSLLFINLIINNSAAISPLFSLICAIIFISTSIAIILDWSSNVFYLTNKRIIHRQGFLWKTFKAVPLNRIQNISYQIGIIGRIIGFGDLIIESAGRTVGIIRLRAIPDPEQIADKIQETISY